MSITVIENNYNTIPSAYSGAFITNEDTTYIGTLSGFDLESSPLTFTVGSGVTHGTLLISSTGAFTYTPTLDYN